MNDKPIIRPYVKRYGGGPFGYPIKWAAAVIVERWAPYSNGAYPNLFRKEFDCIAKEANFDHKRDAERWVNLTAAEYRKTLT